jgi:cis-L-3-hydroxyproline dehydratase
MNNKTSHSGRVLVEGSASGPLLYSNTGLSFWGGVDAASGQVVDRHHSLAGQNLAGKILAIPSGRGSCTGSSVLLELILNGAAPAGLLFEHVEEILTLGVVVAEEIFHKSIPVVVLGSAAFKALSEVQFVKIQGGGVSCSPTPFAAFEPTPFTSKVFTSNLELTVDDQAALVGTKGKAAQASMRIILRMAELQGATELLSVTRAHIDGCLYIGPSSILFAEKLRDLGGRVVIPTTLNAISVDEMRWPAQGIAPELGAASMRLAEAYVAMGCEATYTCAPYLLDHPPQQGEQIVWAESNAVVFANSVLGAHTVKYPDYLDICIALTGRAPLSGVHIEANRKATLIVRLPQLQNVDDGLFALLGYHVGLLSPNQIPLVVGLQNFAVNHDDLKAFGAAFATTSAAAMFHILGVTPEAAYIDAPAIDVTLQDLQRSWKELNSATELKVDVICLGSPHLSFDEFVRLAALCEGRVKNAEVAFIITSGRAIYQRAKASGYVAQLEKFGVQTVSDTCWCQIGEPLFPPHAKTLMTNSGKYAHYGPGLIGRPVYLGSMKDCVDVACTGLAITHLPPWLVVE